MLYTVFRTAAVQTYITQKMASYLSGKLKTEITVGGVDISWFLDIEIENVSVKDLRGNTLLNIDKITADIQKINFSKNIIFINQLELDHADINIARYKSAPDFNYQFIIDYFSTDEKPDSTAQAWRLELKALDIKTSVFSYNDERKAPTTTGIDFNHIKLSELNTSIQDIGLNGDTITAQISALSAKEKSGFVLHNLSAGCTLSPTFVDLEHLLIRTGNSDIALQLHFDYANYGNFYDFIDSVKLDAGFQRSIINLKDLAYFAPVLYGMENIIDISGHFRGKINDLKGKNIELSTGKSTHFKGNLSITGLPDIEVAFINFSSKYFTTTLADINSFKLPSSDGTSNTLQLPTELAKLGYLKFNGKFTGFINDFVAYGTFNTNVGELRTDISLKTGESGRISYKGNVALNDFNLGKMLSDEESFGKVSFDLTLNGSGLTFETINAGINGSISSAEISGYQYKNITIAGNVSDKTFSGYFDIREKNINLDFEGSINMQGELPVFDFSSELKHLQLNKLNLTSSDTERDVSGSMKCRFKGKSMEDISGVFLFSNLNYKENDKELTLKNLQINNVSDANRYKNIVINSEMFDANIEGYFSYKDLPVVLHNFAANYLPSYIKDTVPATDSLQEATFRYDFKLKSSGQLTRFLLPGTTVSHDFNLYGRFNYKENLLSIEGSAAEITFNDIEVSNWHISGASSEKKFLLNTGADEVEVMRNYSIKKPAVFTTASADSILFDFKWFSSYNKNTNNGDFTGFLSFAKSPVIELSLLKGNVYINDSLWVIRPQNKISFDSTAITLNDLYFSHNNQSVSLDGILSHNPSEKLDIVFDNFDIADFNPLLVKKNVEFKGILSGKMTLLDVYQSPNFISDIRINGITVNNDKLGNLILKTNWDNIKKRLEIYSEIIYVGSIGEKNPFKATGYYYPEAKSDNFDLNISVQNFSLKLLENYLSSFSSDIRAFAYGDLTLKGTPREPVLDGFLDLKRASMKIDYLNTTINFSDTIFIRNNIIFFDSLKINDMYNSKTAVLDGAIYHDYFYDFNLDLNIMMKNLLCLNTNASHNSLFYGTAYATGLCKIYGPVENIVMDIYAKTERNTKFFLPLDSPDEISENNFIKFIIKDTANSIDSDNAVVNLNGIQLNFDLEVTSDAEAQLIFDSKIGDIIKAKGNGNLKMEINTLGDFFMYGDYIIEEGEYLFTLQNFINKRFKIEKGSRISWSGDPYMAVTDVDAIYNLRTPLYDLVFSVDSSEEYKKRMPVNCILGMKGNLFNPDISFKIDLPGTDEKTKNMVNTLINSDAEVNRQMFSLLALNRFLPPSNLNEFSNIGIGTGLEATSTELLSNQLSNWLSQISNDFDIGVNYRAGNKLTSDEVEVALSTQLFNDRVSIDGSVANNSSKQNASQIVGDVNVEVKLTDEGKFRMKFYNKSNAVDMLKNNAPYTQGIGLFYRKEFDSFSDLMRKRK